MTAKTRGRIGTTENDDPGSGTGAPGIVLAILPRASDGTRPTPVNMPNRNDEELPTQPSPAATTDEQPLAASGLGSGLLAQQPTPDAEEAVAVARVCPQCGGEY